MSPTESDMESKLNSGWQQELVNGSEKGMASQISCVEAQGESNSKWETKNVHVTGAVGVVGRA